MSDDYDEAVSDLTEAVVQAVMAASTDDDGYVALSTAVILDGLTAATAWFMALNPDMADKAARHTLVTDTAGALSVLILAAREDHAASGVDALMAGGMVQ